jgi:hypothetical protein
MSEGYAKLELMKGNKMTNYEKMEMARKLLETKMDTTMAFATMYGYLAVLVNEKDANFVLDLAQKRVS